MVGSPPLLALAFCAACIFGQLVDVAQSQSQNKTQPRTDPTEVRALNSVFQKWGISAQLDQWNISGEPCSGAAIDSSHSTAVVYPNYNPPFIKCDCSFNNNSTCHITQLVVYGLDVFGVIPEELWTLTFLFRLNLAHNYLTGSLSASIGNLTRMKYLYLGFNALSGTPPKELGNLTDLKILGLLGNSFQGPIPSSFSNLTSLEDLRLSGWSNGSSSLAFIKDMKSLSVLVLRNNSISDSIPSDIGEYQYLTRLDLSFNNIRGPIPDKLFKLSSLTHLFLGNNELSGNLPAQKSSSLLNIDLSYNYLSGSFPSWVNDQSLQLNLVANNYTLESSDSSALPFGLNCLQRSFRCNQSDSGIYSEFAIRCGGPQLTYNQTVYERDTETLGPATYYVSYTKTWAVSNVGYYEGKSNQLSNFTNLPELFQTARQSALSLRYYGLGLQNGNYTVTLYFVETAFPDNITWQSLGGRVFDVYIQGNLVLLDFDIRKEAGGSFRPIEKNFSEVSVSENYLEIHFIWTGKGTCCVPNTFGPTISAISAINNNPVPKTEFIHSPRSSNGSLIGLTVGIIIGVGSVLAGFIAFYNICKSKRLQTSDDKELLGIDARTFTFSYAELKTATEDFNPDNKLGEGGFGPVYKGTLYDGRVVAVKQLSVTSHQGKNQFIAEIATISTVQHRNLVKLHGCCIEGDKRLLVYEYLENKSLDQALFGNRTLNLNWSARFDICLGVARGLSYLHEESRLRIVHRDVKASNILLDSDLIPKISDFGLAKLYDDKKTHISTHIAGTIGYLAPEYAMRGHLTEKADVFAFGVVALEIVSGRPNADSSLEEEKIYLLEWAWQLHENNREVDLVDSTLSEFDEREVKQLIGVSLLCTQASPTLRPSMSRVVGMLSGDIEVSTVTSRPGYLTDWTYDDITNVLSEGATIGTDTSYFNSSSASTSMVVAAENSTAIKSKPMPGEIFSEGR